MIYDRSGAVTAAPIIATTAEGSRVVAIAKPEVLKDLAGVSLVGETVDLEGEGPPVYTPRSMPDRATHG